MNQTIESLVRIADTEFAGPSLMGPAFLPCLKSIPAADAASTATYEGYSAWGVALHVLYHKWAAIRLAGWKGRIPAFAYEETDWPPVPADRSQAAWDRLHSELEAMHKTWIEALRAFPMERWDEVIPAWSCTVGQVLDCIALHDLYHIAQVRNMGLPRLRSPKNT